MKYILFATMIVTNTVFAYTTTTVGNRPAKDPAFPVEKRDPASTDVKVIKHDKLTSKKTEPSKK